MRSATHESSDYDVDVVQPKAAEDAAAGAVRPLPYNFLFVEKLSAAAAAARR